MGRVPARSFLPAQHHDLGYSPLAQRPEDIPLLVRHFLKAAGRSGCRLHEETLEALVHYQWPGNIRELKNIIERALSLSEKNELKLEHLPIEVLEPSLSISVYGNPDNLLAQKMGNFEKSLLQNALQAARGNMSKTAKLLGISRASLYEKFQKYDLRYSKN